MAQQLAIIFSFLALWNSPLMAFFPNSLKATPLTYEVKIHRIEFQNEDGVWKVFADVDDFNNGEDVVMDIASVSAGQAVGVFGQTGFLPPGTYSQMRFVINPSFTAKGAAYDSTRDNTVWLSPDANQVTVTEPQTGAEFTLDTASFVSGNSLAQKLQEIVATPISMPDNTEALEESGMESEVINGITYFYGDMPLSDSNNNLSFTVGTDGVIPAVELDFNVTDRLEFIYEENLNDYVVALQGPDVKISINGVTITSIDDEQQPQ